MKSLQWPSLVLLALLLVLPVKVKAGSEVEVLTSSGQKVSVSSSTAYVMDVLKKRQARAISGSQAVVAPAPVQQAVVVKPEEPTAIAQADSQPPIQQVVAVAPKPQKKEDYVLSGAGTGAVPFHEFSLWAGAWKNLDHGSKGLWAQGEVYKKFSPRPEPENFGLGLIAKADYGWLNSDIDWGYYAGGPAFAYWRALSPEDEFQAKIRLPYRWDMNDRGDGWMPGLYLEYARNLSRKDTLIVSAEGWHFTNDSYIGFQAIWERYVNRDVKLKFGGLAYASFLGDGTHLGWGPTIGVKLWDKLTIGASLSFVSGSTMVGGIVGYDYNSALDAVLTASRQNGVKQLANSNKEQALGDISFPEVTISNQTLAEEIRQKEGG